MNALLRLLRATLPGSGPVPGLSEARGREFLARFRAEAPWPVMAGLYGSALLVLLTPPLTIRRWRSAASLGEVDLDRHLHALTRHPRYLFRQAILMLKATAGLAWGSDPEVRRALGQGPYAPDPGTWRGS